jgi:hypothetical protein
LRGENPLSKTQNADSDIRVDVGMLDDLKYHALRTFLLMALVPAPLYLLGLFSGDMAIVMLVVIPIGAVAAAFWKTRRRVRR